MTTGVYKITNLVNGKVYIGASKNIEKRWSAHRNGHTPIADDLKTFGLENFKFEVLLECPEDMLCQWERDMICLYDADDPKKGYNSPKDSPYSLKRAEVLKGRHLSEETKRKMSETHKGKSLSDEAKRKLSEALKGRSSKRKGITLSEEHRRKISETRKGHMTSDETRRRMSEAHKGKPAWNRGKSHSEEAKRKMSEARRLYLQKKKESICL